jgi:hypothetical protein
MTACAINLNVAVSFGGRTWPISNADISIPTTDNPGICIGGIFDLSLATGLGNIDLASGLGNIGPGWVFGAAFLVRSLAFDHQSTIRLDLILSVDVEKCLCCLPCDTPVRRVRTAVSRGRGCRYAYFSLSHPTRTSSFPESSTSTTASSSTQSISTPATGSTSARSASTAISGQSSLT